MTKSFSDFMKLCEVYDPDVQGKAQITKSGEGGRLHRTRKKSEPEIRRTKAAVSYTHLTLPTICSV